MARFEARIPIRAADLRIHFDNAAELQAALAEVPALAKALEESAPSLPLKLEADGGYADLCSVSPSGIPKLKKHPKTKGDAARLVLFLAPAPLDMGQWKEASGVSNPLAYVPKKEIIRGSDGRYTLESDGRKYVTDAVIPQLRAS